MREPEEKRERVYKGSCIVLCNLVDRGMTIPECLTLVECVCWASASPPYKQSISRMVDLLKLLQGTCLDHALLADAIHQAVAAGCRLSSFFKGILLESGCTCEVRMEKWTSAMAFFSYGSAEVHRRRYVPHPSYESYPLLL